MADSFSNPHAKGANSGMGSGGNEFKNPHVAGKTGISGTDTGFSGSGYGSGTMKFKGSAPTPPPSPAKTNEELQARKVSPGTPSKWKDSK